jgi:AbrB family looped-hinge helix DNA binding protein
MRVIFRKTSMYSTMTSKGQVTIPAALRHSFGFREGSAVEFFSTGEFVGVRPVQAVAAVPQSGFGMFKTMKKQVSADFDAASLLAQRKTQRAKKLKP